MREECTRHLAFFLLLEHTKTSFGYRNHLFLHKPSFFVLSFTFSGQAPYSHFLKCSEKMNLLQCCGFGCSHAQCVWGASLANDSASRLHFAVRLESLEQKRYCTIETAAASALPLARMDSNKLDSVHAEKDWGRSCVKDAKASLQASGDLIAGQQRTLRKLLIRPLGVCENKPNKLLAKRRFSFTRNGTVEALEQSSVRCSTEE